MTSTELDPDLTFGSYVVGPSNQMAAAAARRSAQQPGASYNPLVIYGASGLGKTHLLSAIAHLATEVQPDLRLRYEALASFVDHLSAAIAEGTVDVLRRTIEGADLWLLDDIQDLAAKPRTQEELTWLWDSMIPRGAQVVLASDRPPHEIEGLDDYLAARLSGGLIVDVGPPDAATRLAILRQTVGSSRAHLNDEVLQAVAGLDLRSVPELQEAARRLAAVAEEEERDVTTADVAATLGSVTAASGTDDEFDSFLSDITSTLEEIVEGAPWRRAIGAAILRWEGAGFRTRRLEEVLEADSAPDVDALIEDFEADVQRLRQVEDALDGRYPDGFDPEALRDPDRLAEAEAALASVRHEPEPPAKPARQPAERGPDEWFYDAEKAPCAWYALEDRLMEEPG